MKVCRMMIYLLVLTLQDGNIGLINAEIPIFTRTEGESITVECVFTDTGRRTYFCKDECKDKDILVETNEVRNQRGRYSIENKNTPEGKRVYVTITQLTKSDSGQYRCGLDIFLSIDPYWEFKIIVTDAPSISKPNLTLRPSVQPASTPTATTPTRSSTPSSSSTETTNQPEEQQSETSTAGGSGVVLYVRLTLFILLILISLPALILWKKRATKPKEYPVETVHDDGTEVRQVYEEIREDDRQSRSPPVQISSVHTVRYAKPSDEDSFITATQQN